MSRHWKIGVLIMALAATAPRASSAETAPADWLVTPVHTPVTLAHGGGGREIILSNGLMSRTFRIAPNAATVSLRNLTTGSEMVRGVKPEATITLDGQLFDVGGLNGQKEYGYLLPEWLDSMTSDPGAFQFTGYDTGATTARFAWPPKRYREDLPWPPKGLRLTLHFAAPAAPARYHGVSVDVNYEMYEGLPALCKWLTVRNGSDHEITLTSFTNEMLAVVEAESSVEESQVWKPWIHLQSDYAFGGGTVYTSDHTTRWEPDPQYTSQVTYSRKGPYLLTSRPPIGPDQRIPPGASFDTFRTFELLYDSDDRERQGLALRRMQRVVAPWITENPILMHLTTSDSASIRRAVDQCARVGFEMIILSFGSGFNMESEDPAYLARVKADVDYAHGKGIEIGGYTLTSSREVDPKYQVIDPATNRPGAIFGTAPCLASAWSDQYFSRLRHFIEVTGLDAVENDGSYPGDVCASTTHAHHRGAADSQWAQWKTITGFYQWCRARDIYLNVPDYYFLAGSNKTAMGYREDNWSLPRDQQIILGRQNIYDGTWEKAPSMGWMFVPLVQYHVGGAAATLEPLSEHLEAYGAHLAQNFGSGVQACYRGPRLFDSDTTENLVEQWVKFYKAHRAILDSDIIHVRRPDGVDLDCMLHANPGLKECGLAMVYNPSDQEKRQKFTLPLYYTGITDVASIRERDGRARRYKLDRQYRVTIPITMPPKSATWFVIEKAGRNG